MESGVIFVDSNIPMYLSGSPHPAKEASRALVEQAMTNRERLVTDAEVIQELIHRYSAQRRYDAIRPAIQYLTDIVEEVFPIERRDAERAAEIVLVSRRMSSRDAIHIAVMERHGVDRILSFDADFDAWPGISRIGRV